MSPSLYRYLFAPEVPLEGIEATLFLTLFAAESLHGEAQVRLDAAHELDKARRACTIDAGTPVGQDLNRLFTGFVSREFGADAFRVARVQDVPAASPMLCGPTTYVSKRFFTAANWLHRDCPATSSCDSGCQRNEPPAKVDSTSAPNASTRTDLGVSARRAQQG